MIAIEDKILKPNVKLFLSCKSGDYLGIIDQLDEESVLFAILIRVMVPNVEKFLWTGEVSVFAHYPSFVEMQKDCIHISTPYDHPFPEHDAMPASDDVEFIRALKADK